LFKVRDDGFTSRNGMCSFRPTLKYAGTAVSEAESSPTPTQETQPMEINWNDPYGFLYN
jgi:hypothetical protein